MQDFDTLWKKCIELYRLTEWNKGFSLSSRENGAFYIRVYDFPWGDVSSMSDGNTPMEALQSFHTYLCEYFSNRIQSLKDEGNSLLADAACLQMKVKEFSQQY